MRVTYQATGRHAMLEEDNKDGSKVFLLCLVLLASISVRSEIYFLVWKGLINRCTIYFAQVNHILSGVRFALSSNFSLHANL